MNTILPDRVLDEQEASLASEIHSRMCIVRQGDCAYAFALCDIQEISPAESIATLAGMPPIIKGVSNVRGTVVPIIDLRLMLRLPRLEQQAPQFTVVLRYKEYQVGILVDGVPEILTVRPEHFIPVPEHETEQKSIVAAALRFGEDLASVFDMRRLIASLESEASHTNPPEVTDLFGNHKY